MGLIQAIQIKTGNKELGRYFLEISYNGANYSGWQSQKNADGIQDILERTGTMVFREEMKILGSSRTDAGVHALRQIAQTDFPFPENVASAIHRWNLALPPDIAIRSIRKVKDDVQCRFAALSRSYQYRICRFKNPFEGGTAHVWSGPLNMEAMRKCCGIILQTTDFQAFSKVHTQVFTFNCQVEYARWVENGDMLFFEIKANRFLRGMVRALVGTMLEVGRGKKSVEDFQAVVDSKDRKKAGENAPAEGLFLMEVEYPSDVYL